METDSYLMERYDAFNRAYFRDLLPRDIPVFYGAGEGLEKVHIHGMTECTLENCETSWIRLSPELKPMPVVALMTLLHTMCHLKSVYAGEAYLNHGWKWQREMKRLANIGAFNGIW
jgi:hypothetical protein